MQKHKRGIALFTVLTVSMFLTILTVAMLGNHQSNFVMLTDSINLRQAQLAAAGGLDFAKYKLELNRNYCKVPFDSNANVTATDNSWGEIDIKEASGFTKVTGSYQNSSPPRGFVINIYNYLDSTDNSQRPQKDAVRINTTGSCGSFQVSTEVVLVEAPLYDSAACSNGLMDLSVPQNWLINSTDSLRNWVRSNTAVYTPNFLSTAHLTFELANCTSPGVIWSKGDIFIGNQSISGQPVTSLNAQSLDPTYPAKLQATNGQMASHSSLNYNIYDLKLGDLKRPTDGATPPNQAPDVEVLPGSYTVTNSTVTYTDEKVYYQWHDDGWGGGYFTMVQSSSTQSQNFPNLLYTSPSGVPMNNLLTTPSNLIPAPGLDGSGNPVPPNTAGWVNGNNPYTWNDYQKMQSSANPGAYAATSRTITLPLPNNVNVTTSPVINIANSFTTPEMSYNFSTNNFTLTNTNSIHVNGDLTINSTQSAGVPWNPAGPSPQIPNLGFIDTAPAGAAGQPGFFYANSTTPASLAIEGTVNGKGGVAAQWNLHVAGNSGLNTDLAHLSLVLWSGNNIVFDVNKYGDMVFQGLVFAKQNALLQFLGGGSGGILNNLVVNGALVAQNADISLMNATTVNMTYNPTFLNLFTTGLPGGTARFCQVSYKITYP